MRIAFVSLMAGAPWAASELLWAQTAQRALEQGHEVLISTYRWNECPPALSELASAGALLSFRPRTGWQRRSALLSRLVGTFRPLHQFRPDIVCISQGGSYDVARGGSTAALRQTLARLMSPYTLLCHREQAPPALRRLRIAQQMFADAAFVGLLADKLKNVSETQLRMRLPNARIFHNPVNVADFRSAQPIRADATLRMATVGRLEPVKNLGALIEALSDTRWQTRPWSLTVCGTGSQRDRLEDHTRERSLTDRITFAGHVDDIDALWSTHDVLILPSHFEGVPLAMVEAMLCGRPVVATDVGGISEWIEEGRNGFLIDQPSPAAIDAVLEQLWAQRDHLQVLGDTARALTIAKRDADPVGTLLGWLVSIGSRDSC